MYDQISGNLWRSRLLMLFFMIAVGLIGYVFARGLHDPIILPLAIIIAVAMTVGSFYNSDKLVLAVSGAALGHPGVLVTGLIISVVLMGTAAALIARVLDRYRALSWAGLALILFVALKLIWEGSHQVIAALF